MKENIKEIIQISLYFKDGNSLSERVNEVALFQPLKKETAFDTSAKPLQMRQWTFFSHLTKLKKLLLKVRIFFFEKFKVMIPPERRTPEAQFKTVLSILLAQESLRELFLSSPIQREKFFQAIKATAQEWGAIDEIFYSYSKEDSPIEFAKSITTLKGKTESLLDDSVELNLQIASLPAHVRNDLLFRILNRLERSPLTSILEVIHPGISSQIQLTTCFAKYEVQSLDPLTGKISCRITENQATSSIKTLQNIQTDFSHVVNQRVVLDTAITPAYPLGYYSGAIQTQHHVLEQLLFILGSKDPSPILLKDSQSAFEKKEILFISLYSWNEWDYLTRQHRAIESLEGHILKTDNHLSLLSLSHYNIPFNVLNRYPLAAETQAMMEDLNDKTLIDLTLRFFRDKKITIPKSLETVEHEWLQSKK